MKQVFATSPKLAGFMAMAVAAALLAPETASAAPVRGRVKSAPRTQGSEQLGYTRTRVAAASERMTQMTQDVALFLKVEESLPIPKPEAHLMMEFKGLQLVPDVATCAVDATVVLKNSEAQDVTILIGKDEVRLAAGATHEYECTVGDAQRRVRVKEWPHVRALVFVGEVGVSGAPVAQGNFRLAAPDGKYELLITSRDGVLTSRAVEVRGSTVNLGEIDLNVTEGQTGSEAP